MFRRDDDNTIHLTRGDICDLPIMYMFSAGDVIRFKVMKKKDCNTIMLQRDFVCESSTDSYVISLSGDDTKIGEVISKPTDYWYEVELNPDTNPKTILGYDEDGAKILRLYPEGKDVDGDDIEVVGSKTLQELVNYALEQAKKSGEFKGDKGDKGDSPTVSVTAIDGGHQVDITDDIGTKTFFVMDGKDGESPIVDIGFVPIYGYMGGWKESIDATNSVTFKPTMAESYDKCYKPMSFRAEELGSGTGDGYVFHNDYVFWDYRSLRFDMYFHTFTKTGEKKVVKLVYEYDDYETSPPRSITAYFVDHKRYWEDISTVTLTEEASAITVNLDANGNPFSLSDIIFEITLPAEDPVQTRSIYFGTQISTDHVFSRSSHKTNINYITGAVTYARIVSGRVICEGAISGPTNTRYQPYAKYATFTGYGDIEAESFDSISVFTYSASFPSGTTVRLRGIRK